MKVLMGSRSQDWLSHCLLGEFSVQVIIFLSYVVYLLCYFLR